MRGLRSTGGILLAVFAMTLGATATAAVAANNAQFISQQNVPWIMGAGETRTVSITMKNTGTTTWTRAAGYKLGTQNPQDNTVWTGGTRIYLSASDVIAPQAQKTFSFDITAPTTPGTYNFQWRMVHEGVEWFGGYTTNVAIQVIAAAGNGAQFISQSVPSTMTVGEIRTVSITMKNTGTNTWTRAAGYKLGTQNPQDNTRWTGTTRIYLGSAESIAPQQQKTFSFNITAPTTPGLYNFQWRMVQEGVVRALSSVDCVGLDVETLLDLKTLCLVQLATPERTFLIDPFAVDVEPLAEILSAPRPLKVIHNASFERRVLAAVGIALHGVFDTLQVSGRLRGADALGGHGLGAVCERELGAGRDKSVQTSNWGLRPLTVEQVRYAALDAEVMICSPRSWAAALAISPTRGV